MALTELTQIGGSPARAIKEEFNGKIAEVDWKLHCQNEANMKAQRMLASNEYAASGYVHYGKHFYSPTWRTVNEGMSTQDVTPNWVRLGWVSANGLGKSVTPYPLTHIAGFISRIAHTNEGQIAQVKFPSAPDGTVIYDSTGNARGSGKATLDLSKEVDPKYGNVASTKNEAVARAFEGLVKNGDFRYGTASWVATYGGNVFAAAGGIATLSSGNSRYTGIEQRVSSHVTGLKYNFELTVHEASTDAVLVMSFNNEASGQVTVRASELPKTYRIEGILATASSGNCRFYFDSGNATAETFKVSNFSWKPMSEEVVTERVDMFGFEYFLEEVSQANPFVYPYGCIQSQDTSMEGIATTASNRPVTYYAVFDGDTTSKGKGVNFWTLTDEQKKKVVSNPDHNIYLMDDGRLVQWRVRQRTVAGAGNGKWYRTNPDSYDALGYKAGIYTNAQGSGDVVSTGQTDGNIFLTYGHPIGHKQVGVFSTGTYSSLAVDGECYFHVNGVVPRLNSGAYHPSLNAMGTRRFLIDGGHWYNTSEQVFVTKDTFIKSYPATGYIGTPSGRPDGRFYDAIYSSGLGGVIDYRKSAYDMSSKEDAAKVFQKVVNGSYRGEEELVHSTPYLVDANGKVTGSSGKYTELSFISEALGDSSNWRDSPVYLAERYYVYNATKNWVFTVDKGRYPDIFSTDFARHVYFDESLARDVTDVIHIVVERTTNIPVSGNFTQVDVIGSPEKILQTPALANGWLGGWIPKIPSGESGELYQYTRKAVSVMVGKDVYSRDGGATWAQGSFNQNFNNTLNGRNNWTSENGIVYVIPYIAFAKQTKPSTNKPVLNGSEGLGDVYASSNYKTYNGVLLTESFIGKVCTSTTSAPATTILPLFSKNMYMDISHLPDAVGRYPEHAQLKLDIPDNNSPAVKTLWYQSANNQEANLSFAWNELKYSGGSWQDDDTVRIIDNTGTFMNLANVECLYGSSELTIPYGYTKNQARTGTQTSGVDL